MRTGLAQLVDSTGTHTVTLSGNGIAGSITVSPTSLQFANTPLGQSSANKVVQVMNSGNGPLQLNAITVSGDFVEADTCANTTLAAGKSCSITVTFQPTASGTRTGTMVIGSNASSNPVSTTTVALSGGGQGAFNIVLTPPTLDFGSAFVGATSPVQNITISNTGAGSGKLGAAAVSGDFVLKANTCGTTLATQTGCTVSIAFAPGATGTRTGTFTLTDDAGTQTAALTGVGTAAATDTLTPLSLAFGPTTVNTNSSTQTVSLTNSGDVALTLVAARITSGDFTAVNGCGPSLAAHASCSISVTFSPRSVGAATGTLEIDDVQRAQIVPLTGTGTAGAGVSLSPASLTFASTGVGNATSAQAVTLTNNGTVPLTLTGITVSGDFALVAVNGGGCAAGATLPVQSSCTLQVAFAPRSAGARLGSLSITSNAPTQTVALNGQGIDFSFASNGAASVTVATGKSATFPLLLTPAVASSLPVTFTCTGAPSNAKCTVTSQYNDLSATSTVSAVVQTGVTVAMLQPGETPGVAPTTRRRVIAIAGWLALFFPLGLFSAKRRAAWVRGGACLILGLVVLTGSGGCGSGRKTADTGTGTGTGSGSGSGGGTVTTPTGSYNLVVAVTGAGLTKQVPLTLVVTAQ